MKKLLLTTLSVAALSAFGAGFAFAQEETTSSDSYGADKPEKIREVDTNGDGFISLEEHLAKAQKRFEDADANNDGKLSREEMKAHHEKMKDRRAEKAQMREDRKAAHESETGAE